VRVGGAGGGGGGGGGGPIKAPPRPHALADNTNQAARFICSLK
jgi:hypothetical protein